jgi:uncharacterized protein (DUF4415 family)
MFLKTKSGRLVELPTDEEDAAINAGIAADPDSPEWTEEDFARARPASEVLPEIFGAEAVTDMLKPKGGRPPKENPKVFTGRRRLGGVQSHRQRLANAHQRGAEGLAEGSRGLAA